jgi:hypothetical protein
MSIPYYLITHKDICSILLHHEYTSTFYVVSSSEVSAERLGLLLRIRAEVSVGFLCPSSQIQRWSFTTLN